MIPYQIDYNLIRMEARKGGFTRILLQLPAGLQIYATEIADELSEFEVYISSRNSYGACDIETHDGMLTVHIGHSKIPNIEYPKNIVFVESPSKVSFIPLLEKIELGCKSLGLVASIQHVNSLNEVKDYLEARGVEVRIGKGDGRVNYPGQVLGCNFSTARSVKNDVDCFLFLGSGIFHALGVAVSTKKRVYALDPYSGSVEEVNYGSFLRKRYGAVSSVMDAQRFGIIVSSKIGQRRMGLARELKRIIEESGRVGYLIMTDEIVPENMYYEVDAYVNTACPRVTYDDYSRFRKPVVTPGELMIALGRKDWDSLGFDEIVEVD